MCTCSAVFWGRAACYTRLQVELLLLVAGGPLVTRACNSSVTEDNSEGVPPLVAEDTEDSPVRQAHSSAGDDQAAGTPSAPACLPPVQTSCCCPCAGLRCTLSECFHPAGRSADGRHRALRGLRRRPKPQRDAEQDAAPRHAGAHAHLHRAPHTPRTACTTVHSNGLGCSTLTCPKKPQPCPP